MVALYLILAALSAVLRIFMPPTVVRSRNRIIGGEQPQLVDSPLNHSERVGAVVPMEYVS